MEKMKQIAVVAVFFLVIFGLTTAHFLLPDQDISAAERKELAQAPTLSAEAVFDASFFKDGEAYLLDQFPARSTFLDAKKWIEKNIFRVKSSSGYAGAGEHLTKLDPTLNEASVNKAVSIFNQILQSHPQIANAYYSIIPDKNYYLYYKTDSKQPTMNYDRLYELMEAVHAEAIDLRELLTIDDYYRTDSHWKQENILPVAQALCQAMGTIAADRDSYTEHRLEGFKGVYYALADGTPTPDTLTYLTNTAIDNARVKRMNERKQWMPIKVYNEKHFGAENTDSYDVFLDGAEMLITIDNPNATSDKHLILFRDSYGSSITPLLIDSYQKITMIDIRYISSMTLDQYVDFAGADVLFLYSTTMLNTAGSVFQ